MTKKEALELVPELEKTFTCNQNNPHHIYNVGDHILKSVDNINRVENLAKKEGIELNLTDEQKTLLQYVMLLHDIGKPNVKEEKNGVDTFLEHDALSAKIAAPILERLGAKNSTVILSLITCHDRHELNSDKSVRKLIKQIGKENIDLFIAVKLCDIFAQSDFQRANKITSLKNTLTTSKKIINKEIAEKNISMLPVKGSDLIAKGLKGPDIGIALTKLNNEFSKNPLLSKEELLSML